MSYSPEDEMEPRVVTWPKHFKPLPPGYVIVQLDSGHYLWTLDDEWEGSISWDRFWVRRCAFAHAEECAAHGPPVRKWDQYFGRDNSLAHDKLKNGVDTP